MRKCVTEKILANWLEIFLTYLEIYTLDVELIMEVGLNEQKHFCIMLFEGSNETQSVELNEYQMSTIKFGIIGKTITSNGRTVFGNTWLCYVIMWKTTFLSANWNMGWRSNAVEKEHSKQLANMTTVQNFSERQR